MITYHADLDVTVPIELVDEFLRKLPYVSQALVEFELDPESRTRVRFDLRTDDPQQATVVSDRIAETARKMCRNHRPGEAKVLVDRMNRAVRGSEDPHSLLEASGELFRYGAGRYGLGPECVRLLEFFDRRFTRLAHQFAAVPHQYPSMIGADTLDRCKYLQSFPHSLSLISHLREDLEALLGLFKKKVLDLGVNRAFTFTGYQPPDALPDILAAMDICIDTLEKGFHSEARSSSSIWQWHELRLQQQSAKTAWISTTENAACLWSRET